MSFDPKYRYDEDGNWVKVEYPNRKDWRKQYFRRGRMCRADRPNGGCPYCYSNRFHSTTAREMSVKQQLMDFKKLPVGLEKVDIDDFWDYEDDDNHLCGSEQDDEMSFYCGMSKEGIEDWQVAYERDTKARSQKNESKNS